VHDAELLTESEFSVNTGAVPARYLAGLRTRVDLESEQLVFVARDVDISSVLMIVPLVRIGGRKGTSRTARYFCNARLEDGRCRYVSYHFEDEPSIEVGT
jgi:hypothetical protein